MTLPRCLKPFTELEISDAGKLLCCCWGKYGYLGDLHGQSINQAWNNSQFQKLRVAFYQNKYQKLCDARVCHVLLKDQIPPGKDELPNWLWDDINRGRTILSSGPLKIKLSDIGTCNLNCIMCFRYFAPEDSVFSRELVEKKIPEFLAENPNRELTIKLTGNGDPFARKETKQFLLNFNPNQYPNVSFEILTNGQLLDEDTWKLIAHNKIEEINVSVDAASKETYEKIRKGGNWDKLMKNLRMIGNLRKKGVINYFYINMVVMRSNYREIIKFSELGKSLGCDEVNYQVISGLHLREENFIDYYDRRIVEEIKSIFSSSEFLKVTAGLRINKLQFDQLLNGKRGWKQYLKSEFKLIHGKIRDITN